MELRNMENSIKFRETIVQVGMACREIAFGCEQCGERIEEVELYDIELLAGALHEINEVAKQLLQSMKAHAPDPDGDTQPGGLEPPTLKCPCGYHGPLNDDQTCPNCGDDGRDP
jgi:hypothetical protein